MVILSGASALLAYSMYCKRWLVVRYCILNFIQLVLAWKNHDFSQALS